MIPLDHEILREFLNAARTECCDSVFVRCYLLDRFADHAGREMGEPGGLTLSDACWWYFKSSDEDEPALREVLATMDELLNPITQQFAVEDNKLIRRPDAVRSMNVAEYRWWDEDEDGIQVFRKKRTPIEIRSRVLPLYPEVEYEVTTSISDHDIASAGDAVEFIWQRLEAAGFLRRLHLNPIYETLHDPYNRRTEYRQTFRASDLIPPEPIDPHLTAEPQHSLL